MSSYPTLTEIEINWRTSGGGLCIIVEGDTDRDDPWFYNHWFGNDARQFTFFPQDGFSKVETGVTYLRNSLGIKKVYGLIDRDFSDISNQFVIPSNGILRTIKYTLENYYLEPSAWFRYFEKYIRNTDRRVGWETIENAVSTLTGYYRQCIPISAYNWTLREFLIVNNTVYSNLPSNSQGYFEHPNALQNLDLAARFNELLTQTGYTFDLNTLYQQRLNQLNSMSLSELETVISGKYVLKLIRQSLARYITNSGWDDVIGEVTNYCLPPVDIHALLELMWQDSLL